MKPTDKIERQIRRTQTPPGEDVRHRTLEEMRQAYKQSLGSAPSPTNRWRTIAQKRAFRWSLATVTVAAAILTVWLTQLGPTPAYAIGQTIKAIDTIKTVHFMAELVKQGPVECWMQFDRRGGRPTHICLFWSGYPLRKVDSPAGSFAVNTATNRIRRTVRDERRHHWYIDFAGFFKSSLKQARKSDSVQITRRTALDPNEEMIVITVNEKGRRVEYLIDPQTKLPVRFSTIELSDFMKYFRETIAVRNMSFIEYNQPVPDGMFEIPEGAEEVFNEHDIIVHPGVGMPVGELTEPEACERIVREIADAMNRRDWEQVTRLMFPFATPPAEFLATLNIEPGKPIGTLGELGVPVQKGDYWYILCKSTEADGEDENVPVKFYEFDGKRYCMVMWPD